MGDGGWDVVTWDGARSYRGGMSQSAASNGVQRPTQLWAEARERDLSQQWLPGTHHLLSQHPVALLAVVTEKGGAHPGRAFVGDTGEGSHNMQLPVANYATALRMCNWDVQLESRLQSGMSTSRMWPSSWDGMINGSWCI